MKKLLIIVVFIVAILAFAGCDMFCNDIDVYPPAPDDDGSVGWTVQNQVEE